ncbi:alpha-L-fucosidase [Roseateles sp.]|uniref:alpha-L-fucosidase n=1 Tax=Roseateles sp. TaxID=1971397 RepID=UPI003BA4F356
MNKLNVFAKLAAVVILLTGLAGALAQNIEGTSGSRQNEPKMQWWKDAKFGMFIHWGIYSVPAGVWGDTTGSGEWLMYFKKIPRDEYSSLAKQFNPTQFNAEEWVKLAKDAGQKYIIITAKHHDGFAMFKSNASAYNIVDATPFKRDVLKELADAARKHGVKLGFYYSQAQDWYHPGGASKGPKWDKAQEGDMESYIDRVAIPQVKEILENYGDVAVIWWDTPHGMTPSAAKKFAAIVKKYPNLITNNRLGGGQGGDLASPEQFIPATGFPRQNWEVCMTMNGHWGYNAWDDDWKSTGDLLRKLIDIASKGGNFLLNVGPNAYGVIPPISQRTLREMGDWLRMNGEAVYSSSASPFPFLSWGRATRKDQTLYLHVFDWPKNGELIVPMANRVTKAYLLANKTQELQIEQIGGSNKIRLPSYAPDKVDSVLALEFDGEPMVLPAPSAGKRVTVSSADPSSNLRKLTDGEPSFAWKAAEGVHTAMLKIDLDEPVSIQSMAIVERWHPWDNIGQKLELQAFQQGEWTKVISDKTNGSGLRIDFAPVRAQQFRLIIENSKEAPGLNEFTLFRSEN